jgi:hypothetical protein
LSKDLLPADIRSTYQVEERHHACSILKTDFPEQWKDLLYVLREFKLRRSDIAKKGGNKSPISRAIDDLFFKRDWIEKSFDIISGDIMLLTGVRELKMSLNIAPGFYRERKELIRLLNRAAELSGTLKLRVDEKEVAAQLGNISEKLEALLAYQSEKC